MKSIKKFLIPIIVVLSLSIIWICYCISDFSETLKADNGYVYKIFQVPITKKLAESFYNCSYYKRSYKNDLFFRIWNAQIGKKDTLQIEPGPQGTCIITHTTSAYSNIKEKKMRAVIPQGLSSRVGEYLLLSFDPSPLDKERINRFSACMFISQYSSAPWLSYWQDVVLKDHTSSFDINNFLGTTQEYISIWDEQHLKESAEPSLQCWNIFQN